MSALSRLGDYISTERGFRRASMVGFGVPAAAAGAWVFKDYGGTAWVLAVPGALMAAYLWGFAMWRLMFRDLYARRRAAAEKEVCGPQ